MASGKLSPRQKMINLMYLIFIAMLALNMSKEVLAAFGLMNEKFEASNQKTTESNLAFLEGLETKASEDAAKYAALYEDAQKIKQISQEYYDYLENLKQSMVSEIEDPTDYQVMDKSDYLDQKFFQGDNLAPEGKKFMEHLNGYREQVLAILGEHIFDGSSPLLEPEYQDLLHLQMPGDGTYYVAVDACELTLGLDELDQVEIEVSVLSPMKSVRSPSATPRSREAP